MAVERCVVDSRGWSGNLSVIGGGVEVDDVEPALEQFDRGDKGVTLDAVFV